MLVFCSSSLWTSYLYKDSKANFVPGNINWTASHLIRLGVVFEILGEVNVAVRLKVKGVLFGSPLICNILVEESKTELTNRLSFWSNRVESSTCIVFGQKA